MLSFGKFWEYRYTLELFLKIFCFQCEYRATQEGNLAHHIQQVHEGAKYNCNQCEYIATHEGNPACHIQSVYEGTKYECR